MKTLQQNRYDFEILFPPREEWVYNSSMNVYSPPDYAVNRKSYSLQNHNYAWETYQQIHPSIDRGDL